MEDDFKTNLFYGFHITYPNVKEVEEMSKLKNYLSSLEEDDKSELDRLYRIFHV
jgi:hypothetical protein